MFLGALFPLYHYAFPFMICYASYQPSTKKAASVKSGVNKKGDGTGQLKSSKPLEPPEDIEVHEGFVFTSSTLLFVYAWKLVG